MLGLTSKFSMNESTEDLEMGDSVGLGLVVCIVVLTVLSMMSLTHSSFLSVEGRLWNSVLAIMYSSSLFRLLKPEAVESDVGICDCWVEYCLGRTSTRLFFSFMLRVNEELEWDGVRLWLGEDSAEAYAELAWSGESPFRFSSC